jgi:hypothetical protein
MFVLEGPAPALCQDSEHRDHRAAEVLVFLIWQLRDWLLFGCKNSQERLGQPVCEGAVRQCCRPHPAVPQTGPDALPNRCSAKFGETGLGDARCLD